MIQFVVGFLAALVAIVLGIAILGIVVAHKIMHHAKKRHR